MGRLFMVNAVTLASRVRVDMMRAIDNHMGYESIVMHTWLYSQLCIHLNPQQLQLQCHWHPEYCSRLRLINFKYLTSNLPWQ